LFWYADALAYDVPQVSVANAGGGGGGGGGPPTHPAATNDAATTKRRVRLASLPTSNFPN
jgi:hypothetical protein